MVFATLIFALSLLGIIILFVLKAWEVRTERFLAPLLRERIDGRALEVKRLIALSQGELRKLPPEMVFLMRTVLHDAALGAASVARFLEGQSHRLADLVSHKRGFERRETRSDFLKHVSGYKNETQEGADVAVPDEPHENRAS